VSHRFLHSEDLETPGAAPRRAGRCLKTLSPEPLRAIVPAAFRPAAPPARSGAAAA